MTTGTSISDEQVGIMITFFSSAHEDLRCVEKPRDSNDFLLCACTICYQEGISACEIS